MKVFSCTGFANFIRAENLGATDSKYVKVTLDNCVFEKFAELFHVFGGQYNVRNCTFIGIQEIDYTHAFHIIDYGDDNNYNYRPIHFSGNKFYNIQYVFAGTNSHGIKIGDNNNSRNEFYNCGIATNSNAIFRFSNMWIENNLFDNCGRVSTGGAYFNNNELRNVKNVLIPGSQPVYSSNNIYANFIKQNAYFLSSFGGNQFMINNDINQNAPIIITKKPNAGYIKSSDGKLFIEGGQFNGTNQTRYVDNSIAKLDISNETVNGGSLITRGVADYDVYDTDINKNGGFSGFNMNMSNGSICNSSSRNATRAFSFQGNCINTSLSENEIGTSGVGLFIDNIIGQQEHKGNTWVGSYSGEGATNISIFSEASRFTVNSNPLTGGNSLFIPQNGNYSPSTFFVPDETTDEIDECIYEFGPNGIGITDIDLLIINNTFNIDPLSNWLAVRNLIRKILNDPTLLNDPNVNNWYQNQLNTPVATTAEIEETMADFFGDDNDVNTIRQVFEDYEAGTYTAIEADYELNSIQSIIKVSQNQKYTDVGNLLGSYNATNVFEDVFEEIYLIYIENLNDDDYLPTSLELTTIGNNANLCPLNYGPSVYIAQSLADKHNIAYDEENCTISRTRTQKTDVNNELKLYPNPANDFVNIEIEGNVILAEILSIEGKVMGTSKSKTIDIKSLVSGLYYVKVLNDNGIVNVSQLVIQR